MGSNRHEMLREIRKMGFRDREGTQALVSDPRLSPECDSLICGRES